MNVILIRYSYLITIIYSIRYISFSNDIYQHIFSNTYIKREMSFPKSQFHFNFETPNLFNTGKQHLTLLLQSMHLFFIIGCPFIFRLVSFLSIFSQPGIFHKYIKKVDSFCAVFLHQRGRFVLWRFPSTYFRRYSMTFRVLSLPFS